MMVEIRSDVPHGTVYLEMSGKLVKEDYAQFVPALERTIAAHGKIRLLLHLRDFHGWTAGALWEDVKFDVKHFADIERLAIVGDRKWEATMATFCKPFTTAEVRYFDVRDLEAARTWVAEGTTAARAATR